jgi:probable F420-dependent oxidoreductase
MRVCMHLPSPRRSWEVSVADLVSIAQGVERAGLDAVCTSDHPFPVVERGRPGHHVLDPFVVLSCASAVTERIALVFSLLVVPYRNPFLTASMLATLDDASHGRVIAGVGSGYLRSEFDALGARYARRARQVRDAVEAMRLAWMGEPVNATGDGWVAHGNTLRPVPPGGRLVPIWRGGNGDSAMAHAAAVCDGWMPFEANDAIAAGSATIPVTVDTLPARIQDFLERREGRPADVCFVRTHPRWLDDPSRAADEVSRLAEAGVTWLEAGSAGRSVSEVIDDAERIAAIVRATTPPSTEEAR